VKYRLAYENGPHALKEMMMLKAYGGRISKVPENIVTLHGDTYYFVEVTSKEETRYIIEAYGTEALELEREAAGKTKERLVVTA
jgi:predicted metal-dependent RNase